MNSLSTMLAPLRRRLGIRFLIDYEPDYRNSVFLAGTARSGTTWVSDIINYDNRYRYIFEPFNPRKVSLVEPFGWKKYLRPEEQDTQLFNIASRVLSGRIRSAWTERFNRRFVSKRRLVKDIRANLFLKWLHVNFPGVPFVFLLRHPCAVACSYAKHGWRGLVEPLLAQSSLVEDFLYPYKEEIAAAKDTYERAVFIWCIETLVPLKQFRRGEIHLMFYEDLVCRPAEQIEGLFAFLGQGQDPAAVLGKINRPSLTSRKDSAVLVGSSMIDSWRKHVSGEQLRRTLEIVKRFGLEGVYANGSTPDAQAAYALMKS